MTGEERRSLIINYLTQSAQPISATAFAKTFGVTRQIIVADIALLRASGQAIKAEHKGYVLAKSMEDGIIKRVVVKHGRAELLEELYIMVDNGARVMDVVVEHPVYGLLSAQLNLANRLDVDDFVSRVEEYDANPLCSLTDGVHLHTLSISKQESYDRILEGLKNLGVYIESN